ncbi:GPI anchored serine-threonine rich family protein [Rhodotorula paludigena]|uniref:GPI anchored serine-threonine rich family protein n=1 Tax=Rhodotorula paludigena TaxID=86838 RepID=UPI00317A0774
MVPSASVLAAAVPVLAAALARAAVTPTAPWSGQVYNVGEKCDIQWNLDTTGEWDSFSITLMTGSNLAMVPVQRVATGLDGTTGEGSYDYTCPDVSPNAAIYFYQFEQAGQPTSWTTRFTIAAADGSTTDPTEETAGIAWGTGKLVSGSSGVSSGAAAGAGAGAGASSAVAASASGPARLSSAAASAGVSTSASVDESSASTDASEPVSTSQSTSSSAAESSSVAAPTSSSSSSNSAPAASQTPARTNVDSGAGRAGAGVAAVLGGVLALVFA